MSSGLQVVGVRILTFVAFAAAWQVFALQADSLLIPTFIETMSGLWEIAFTKGDLWSALAASNVALLIGYPIAVVFCLPLGLASARWPRVDNAVSPFIGISLAVPIAPFIPIVIIALGLGLLPRVLIIVLFTWPFIVINVRAGVKAVDRSLIAMARSFGAGERLIWRKILIPGAWPAIMTGLRVGLGRAVAGMVIVELIMVAVGVGSLLLKYRGDFRADLVFAVVVAVMLEAALLMFGMRALERMAESRSRIRQVVSR